MTGDDARRFDSGGWVADVWADDCGGHGIAIGLDYGLVFGGVGGGCLRHL